MSHESAAMLIDHLIPRNAGGYVEFRPIDTRGHVKHRTFTPIPEVAKCLRQLVSLPMNVYFGILPRANRAGTASDVVTANCVWVDLDTGKPDTWPTDLPKPTAVVCTSPRKWQMYWRLDQPLTDLDRLESINRGLVTAVDGDPAAVDRARVLRLPGSRNLKYESKPLVRLVHIDDRRISIDDLPVSPINRPLRRVVKTLRTPGWLHLVFDAIVDYLEREGFRPRHSRTGVLALCPLHDDKNPSLSLHPERGWKCFANCGQGRLTRLANLLGVKV